jgi:hypothetical protein
MERGVHRHYTHQRIVNVINEIQGKWQGLAKEYEKLARDAMIQFKEWEPLIRYLELEMLRVGIHKGDSVIYKPVRYISTDLEDFQRARTLLNSNIKDQKGSIEILFNPGDLSFFEKALA